MRIFLLGIYASYIVPKQKQGHKARSNLNFSIFRSQKKNIKVHCLKYLFKALNENLCILFEQKIKKTVQLH